MPPKTQRVVVQPASSGRRGGSQPGALKTVWNEVTSPDNRTVVTALGMFVGAVAFLGSSWSEVLLPPV
ncbi:MAG: hypothetical protein M1819_002339 [Sarea resinae]|nr:MAG: hypothetical protein M1819_002339 [Sarea resinae]